MGTQLTIKSTAVREIQPNQVDLIIHINKKNEDPVALVQAITKQRQKFNSLVTKKMSYVRGSYQQTDFNIVKQTVKETVYVHNDIIISENEYKAMAYEKQKFYKLVQQEKAVFYQASLKITFSLYCTISSSVDSTFKEPTIANLADDLADIYSFCITNDYICNYKYTIKNDQYDCLQKDLLVKCINKGMEDMRYIIKGIQYMKDEHINLRSIRELSMNHKEALSMCSKSEIPSQVVIPELIKDTLKVPISYTKTIEMDFEI